LRETGVLSKNLDFPKLHAHIHVFDQILSKGVLRHSTTRLFEGRHPALKKWYQKKSSFRNADAQVWLVLLFSLHISEICQDSAGRILQACMLYNPKSYRYDGG
jgi:hypothetical protein